MSSGEPTILNDRYEVQQRIGRGGMADVFLARDLLLDRAVAIKVLFPEFATDPAFVERFRREAQSAANLNHPNIVGVYDWGRSGNTYFMAMEYVQGRTLADIVKANGRLSAQQATDVAMEVAGALGFAHRNGVVHRDIKPANILIGASGQVKVADFGIARALGSAVESNLTQAGAVMGTATYFSPEQAQGGQPDPRSDLYSLGIVLYEMVGGKPPFSGENPVSIAYKQVHDAPQPLNQLAPDVPRPFEAIVAKLLAKSPSVRYDTAEALRDDLRRFREGQPVLALTELLGAAGASAAAATAGLGATAAIPATPGPATTALPRTQAITTTPAYDNGIDTQYYESPGGRWWIIAASVLAVIALVVGGILLYNALSADDGPPETAPDTVSVPNLIERRYSRVVQLLQAEGLVADPIPEVNDAVGENVVWDQSPPAGTEVKVGDTVSFKFNPPAEIKLVPNLAGRTVPEAEGILATEGLTLGEVTTRSDPTVPEGQVIESVPAAGAEIAAGAPVDLVISEGSGTTTVPNVSGQVAEAARSLLQGEPYLFVVSTTDEASPDVPEGRVIRTEPAIGNAIEVGSPITLFVSTGPAPVEVPLVEGLTEAQARTELNNTGFAIIDVRLVNVPFGDPNDGRVISQTPGAGDAVDATTTIVLRIGRAEPPPTTTSTTTTAPAAATTTTTVTPGP
jgi:beta-lactam-binding protein with PASTA domain/predicted Ser/Thr protein kinase